MNQLHDAHVQTREAVASFAASQDEIDMSRQRAGQHAPEAEAERLYHWALLDRIDEKKIELSEWVAMPAASISEIDRKKQGTSELRAELAALELQFNVPYQAAAQSPATPAPVSDVVEPASDGPAPLTRNEIANCFAGLRGWNVKRWKAELSSPDDWLKACRQRKGTRGCGGYESTWWPVCIAGAMVERQDTTAKLVSARFKNQEPLKPWLDTWQTYHPENA